MTDSSLVLIVEDDSATRHLLEVLVRRNALSPTLAADGGTAIEHLETSDFDVILLDLFLPGIDGWEILRRVSRTTPHLLGRILVVTAASPAECEDFEPMQSVWCVLHKPFELRALEDQLLRCRSAKLTAGSLAQAPVS